MVVVPGGWGWEIPTEILKACKFPLQWPESIPPTSLPNIDLGGPCGLVVTS